MQKLFFSFVEDSAKCYFRIGQIKGILDFLEKIHIPQTFFFKENI